MDCKFNSKPIHVQASAFRGCIANFSINNELIHLANSPNMVGLLPCHSNIEKGAFFDGYAYALFGEYTSTLCSLSAILF